MSVRTSVESLYIEDRILSSRCNLKLLILLQAYRKLIAERGREEPKLPVLGYTPDQLFFISAAQVYACTHMYTGTDAHVC